MGEHHQTLDKVSEVVIGYFNRAGLKYGPRASAHYPVSKEAVFDPEDDGRHGFAPTECRDLLCYIIANHIPLYDDFTQKYRLPNSKFIDGYTNQIERTVNRAIKRGCRLMADPEYKRIHTGCMLRLASDGIETWNVGKAIKAGEC